MTTVKHVFAALLLGVWSLVGQAATVTYFHNEPSGTPIMATNQTGGEVWRETYRPYGDKLNLEDDSLNSNKIGFHGKPFDGNTGLSYMGARYYNPAVGRFMGIDPAPVVPDDLQSFNRYAYANNNPYRYVDPDGHAPTPIDIAFLAWDIGKLGVALYTGVGVGPAAVDVGLGVGGLFIPIPGAGQALKAVRATEHVVEAARAADHVVDAAKVTKTATSSRVTLRKGTRDKIKADQPRNSSGEMVDPHSGGVLKDGEIDIGHKPGQEWWKRKAAHEKAGSTRKQVIEAENDPSLYHLEDRSLNRSHINEVK